MIRPENRNSLRNYAKKFNSKEAFNLNGNLKLSWLRKIAKSANPKLRKKAIFAINARKWNGKLKIGKRGKVKKERRNVSFGNSKKKTKKEIEKEKKAVKNLKELVDKHGSGAIKAGALSALIYMLHNMGYRPPITKKVKLSRRWLSQQCESHKNTRIRRAMCALLKFVRAVNY